MRPEDINSPSSMAATFGRLDDTLTQLKGYSETYGRLTDGPFTGQFKLQALGVEYATAYDQRTEVAQQQAHTEMMWKVAKGFGDSMLGMMWWEPWYCYNDWLGGKGGLCHPGGGNNARGETGETPTGTMKTWGAGAYSPWKE